MNYLSSIITVNSYRGHKINQFNVDDGALIQGSNGAGKTSILRLILLFFGASAREIASISGKNNRFADYYLSSTKSYLVYQYKKGNQDFLVIAFAKGRNEVTYYFCEGVFDEALFVNDAGQFIDCSEIKSHIQSVAKRKVSPAFSWSQYKQVIQSGKRVTNRDQSSQKINEAKLKYSLCAPNQSMDNIEKIAVSILANKPSFHAIRSLIADGILGLDSFLKEDFGSNFDSKHLIQQQNLLRQAKRFKEKQPVLDDIRTASSLMKNWEQEKSVLGGRILQSWQHYSEQLQKLTSNRDQLIHDRDEALDAQNYQIQQLSSQIGERKGESKNLTTRLESLDKKFNDYQKSGIEAKQRLAKRLPFLAEQVSATTTEKEALESNFQHITQQYEIATSEAENRKLKQRFFWLKGDKSKALKFIKRAKNLFDLKKSPIAYLLNDMNILYEALFKDRFNDVANKLNYLKLDSSQLKNPMECIRYAKSQSPY
ncbi:MAG: ATP-binding protein [Hydrogenovibrio sp.]